MKRQFVFGTIMAAALTVGLGAQTPPPQSPTPQSTPQTPSPSTYGASQDRSRPERGQAITLTGCLQSSDAGGATGTSGAAGTAPKAGASSDKFVLTEATSSTDKATGTAGAATSPTIPTKLNLMASGGGSASWSKYVNHKVEVKGTLGADSKPSGAATTPSETPTTPPSANPAGAAGTMSSSDMGATFNVTSIKEVSGSCSGSSIK